MNVNNIYCVGRNYALHAKELGNAVPSKPMIFSKPTHALTITEGQMLTYPKNQGSVHYETELVVRINQNYAKGMKASDCIDKIAIGVDFTLRDVQSELKKKGHPWLLAKGFRNSAVVTPFFDVENIEVLYKSLFSLSINNTIVQKGNPKEMIFSFDEIIEYIGENFGLDEGDIIFTGTPEGVGAINDQDEFILYFNDQLKGSFKVQL